MSISTTYSPDTYSGNGATTSFAITFPFLSTASNVKVSLKVVATGVITVQTNPTHYSITGSNVIMVTAPASGITVIIELSDSVGTDILQEVDYTEYDLFPAETHEGALDKLTLGIQAANDKADRAIKFDASVSGANATMPDPTGNSGKVVLVNTGGTGFDYGLVADLGDAVVLGTGVEDFLTSPSSANLRTALTDETGTGAAVFANTPTLVTPILGTPTSGTLTSCTGLPISTGVSGLGTGVATMLGTFTKANVVTAGGDLFKGYEKISTASASASASITFTDLDSAGTTYSRYRIVIQDLLHATTATNLRLRVSNDNGSSYLAGTEYYYTGTSTTTAAVTTARGAASASAIQLTGGTLSTAGTLWAIIDLGVVTNGIVHSSAIYLNSAGTLVESCNMNCRAIVAGINAIQFLSSSGNLTSGSITLYGLRT